MGVSIRSTEGEVVVVTLVDSHDIDYLDCSGVAIKGGLMILFDDSTEWRVIIREEYMSDISVVDEETREVIGVEAKE